MNCCDMPKVNLVIYCIITIVMETIEPIMDLRYLNHS